MKDVLITLGAIICAAVASYVIGYFVGRHFIKKD